jgi:Ca2+/Na+ antiporter
LIDLKVAGRVLVYLLGTLLVLILSFSIFIFIGYLQYKIFVPDDYVLWIFNYPYSRFIIIIVLYLFLLFFYFFFRKYWEREKTPITRKRRALWIGFIVTNILGFYIIFSSVTVITHQNIIDHSFLYPQGKKYDFNDVVKIDAGVRGDRFYLPFTHNKGDFYYKVEFIDGRKIDLNDEAGSYDSNGEHPTFVLNKLDARLVEMGITKVSSMENFHYTTEGLDRMYTDQIKSILERK